MNKEWEDEEISNIERNLKHLKVLTDTSSIVDTCQQIIDIASLIKHERLSRGNNWGN